MGGYGSGRPRWRNCGTVEASRSLDVNKLNRAGYLTPGRAGVWAWTVDGEQVAWIGMRADETGVQLSYRYWRDGGEWLDVEQSAPITWMPCRFGGRRPYFRCPGVLNDIPCGRRVIKLYGAGKYFLCRHCYRLTFASQGENEWDRAYRRANKIKVRLGGDPGTGSFFPTKPKGMHLHTYDRMKAECIEAELKGEEKLDLLAQRLLKLSPVSSRSIGFWQ